MGQSVQIGWYTEKESHTITRNHTYYAADWQKIETVPGRYPLYLAIRTGFMIPMPDSGCRVGIDANIVDGATYSGWGGVNFASTPETPGPTKYIGGCHITDLQQLINDGIVEINDEWQGIIHSDYGDCIEWARQNLEWNKGLLVA